VAPEREGREGICAPPHFFLGGKRLHLNPPTQTFRCCFRNDDKTGQEVDDNLTQEFNLRMHKTYGNEDSDERYRTNRVTEISKANLVFFKTCFLYFFVLLPKKTQ